jgi:peptide chain release factor 1
MSSIREEVVLHKLDMLMQRHEEIEALMSDPSVIADVARFQRLARERSDLSELVETYSRYRQVARDLAAAEELARGGNDPAMRELAVTEVEALRMRREALEQALQQLLLPKDARDDKNTFIEIRAGTGGEEAALFAAELFRMYSRFAENQGWRVELMSSSPTGIGGLKEAIMLVEGRGAFSRLKYESGVHRVQRVPQTEASGRIHTSTVTVAVLPEADEVEVAVDAKDLRIDTFCASGPGGQGVNTTYSAVRITHLPTGLVVSCQDERSQLKNKAKALRILRSRLLEAEQSRQDAEIARDRRAQVGTGERSEKIRTYNFPQNRVTDHRVGLTLHSLDQVLNGDIEDLVNALAADDQARRLNEASK